MRLLSVLECNCCDSGLRSKPGFKVVFGLDWVSEKNEVTVLPISFENARVANPESSQALSRCDGLTAVERVTGLIEYLFFPIGQ